MWFYCLLLILASIGVFTNLVNNKNVREEVDINSYPRGTLAIKLYIVSIALIIGLRHEVGGDWLNYLPQLDIAFQLNISESLLIGSDPAYSLLVWISAHSGLGIYGANLGCAILFSTGLYYFVINNPKPWLALSVAIPYLVIVVAMGYTRQSAAIGFVMLGLVALQKNSLFKFIVWILIASLFHKSAAILIPLAIFSGRKGWGAVIGVILIGVCLYILILSEHLGDLISGYIVQEYNSSGAAIRIAMNALPAVVYLMFKKRFNISKEQKLFWLWISIGSLIFIPILIFSPSSTAVDRVALYWIPIQIFVWSRLPIALGQESGTRTQWTIVVLAYSFTILIVWVLFADHSYAWVPYKFYPWVWLWS